MAERLIQSHYEDPLDLVWRVFLNRIGIQLIRDPEVFASWDGKETLKIGTPETLDPDDSLAQMIFHETCHACVEGENGVRKPDWGLDISDKSQRHHEFAALRLQAVLADAFGLRRFFAATTNFRIYYDLVPADPWQPIPSCDSNGLLQIEDLEREPTVIQMAKKGHDRATNGPWASQLLAALQATREIARVVEGLAPSDSLWKKFDAK